MCVSVSAPQVSVRDRAALDKFLRDSAADAARRRVAEEEEEAERMRREARADTPRGLPPPHAPCALRRPATGAKDMLAPSLVADTAAASNEQQPAPRE